MKSLVAGIVLIILLGVGGFIYRNAMERSVVPKEATCPAEAKLCPDGTTVSRQGPHCEFAPCPTTTTTLSSAKISFVLPEGYEKGVQEPGGDGEVPGMEAFYQKRAGTADSFHYLTIFSFPIPKGKTGTDVILAETEFSPAGEKAKSMKQFTPVVINGNTFQSVVTERFEGQVVSAYYLVREKDVLKFQVMERNVTDWMNAKLDTASLPEHKALLQMLTTLESK